MYFFIYGLITAIIIATGLRLSGTKSVGTIVALSLLLAIIIGWVAWLAMPTFAWNYGSNWFFLIAIGVVVIVLGIRETPPPFLVWLPLIIGLIVPLGTMFITSPLFNAGGYQRLLGEPIVSTFGADVSPVDINQVRRVDQRLARRLGEKRLEEQPGLGSRVDLGEMNIQTINGCFDILDGNNAEQALCFDNELVWAGPLNHSGMFKAISNGTTPGYVLVSAINSSKVYMVTAIKTADVNTAPNTSARMGNDSTPEGFTPTTMTYLSEGYFGGRVERFLRTSGYAASGLTDYSFEIDNQGQPYWVITNYIPTIGFGGQNALGVVVVNAVTGEINDYNINDAPAWIDRIQPEGFVSTQLNDWGKYTKGFWNTIFARLDIVTPTPGMSLVYGADGQSYWYSGIQSAGSDTATNSFVLVNTRTKETRRYMIAGANESAARASAENAKGVREAGFKGTDPILYNVSGEPTYFLTLKGGDGLVKMFAFVSVRNYETAGVGRSVSEALRDFQNAMIRQGRGINLDDITTQNRITATVVDRVQIGDTFYLRLEGQEGIEFYGTIDVSEELKWARIGDSVVVIVQQGELTSLQIFGFDVPSLGISNLE